MKNIISYFIVINCFYSNSQLKRIESQTLDSLIWHKINEYRLSKGVKSFVILEDSLMRQFCTRVTYRNVLKEIPVHSDSVGYWSNAECLYRFKSSGFLVDELNLLTKEEIYENLAERTVQAWIHSSTHERAISRPEYNISTIVSVLLVDKQKSTIQLEVSFHALDKEHNTFNGYIYK